MDRVKIGWRQLVVIIVVAAIAGGGAGYLGWNLTNKTTPQHVYTSAPVQGASSPRFDDPREQLRRWELDQRLQCIEDKAARGRTTWERPAC